MPVIAIRHAVAVTAALFAACSQDPSTRPPRPAPSVPWKRTALPPPLPAMVTGEDPPYAENSVLRPEEHRNDRLAPVPDAVFVTTRLSSTRASHFGHLGQSVGIDGDLVVAGAPLAEEGLEFDAGAVHVMHHARGGWTEEARLVSPRPQSYERFGASVALEGARALVGADGRDCGALAGCGAAYVFERTVGGWSRGLELVPSVRTARGAFGSSTALAGGRAFVGAAGADAAFVFEASRSGWVERATLRPPNALPGAFGLSIAASGDVIVVGAPMSNRAGLLAGAAYVFRRDGFSWRLENELLPPPGNDGGRFGWAVAAHGKTILVGAPRAAGNGRTRAGVAWLFVHDSSGWTLSQDVTADPPRNDEEFGRTLGLTDRFAVVGTHFSDAAGLNTGAATLFTLDGNRLRRRGLILAGDPAPISEFAASIAVDGTQVVVGAPRHATKRTSGGHVYVYRVPD